MKSPDIFIVVAAYNEEKRILKAISGLQNFGYRNVIVVNDGSRDRTRELALSSGAVVLSHPVNLGQGAALRTGIHYALKAGADIIVTFDGDGQHQASEISRLVTPIIDRKADAVLGSRFIKKGSAVNIPSSRKFFLKAGVIFTRLVSRIRVTDTHNGFRALSRRAASRIDIKMNDMTHASEILDEIHKKKIKFVEVPVTITYSEESVMKGQKTSNALRIFAKMVNKKIFG
ncbi:MAG TPA: glycosyltransferase family 2 protein [Candidatus Woesearchaeota archaeon]|nr:glycosyltransferase family 2 protein [Candidatus Woesearchaeota archaeon]